MSIRLRLAVALARRIGVVLTKTEAIQIADEVAPNGEDRAIGPLSAFPADQVGGGRYLLRAERLGPILPLIEPLHAAYHDEVGELYVPMLYEQALLERERAGTLLLLTARCSGGQVVGMMTINLHGVLASDELLYVLPAHRGTLGWVLPKFAERCAFIAGAHRFRLQCLKASASEKIAEFAGYHQVATIYEKVAHDACDFTQVPTRHRNGVAHEPLAPH